MRDNYTDFQKLLIPLTLVAWFIVIGIIVWLLGHISHTIIILIIASLISYTLLPALRFLDRFLPRALGLLLVYLIILGLLGILVFTIARITTLQLGQLVHTIHSYLTNTHTINNSLLGLILHSIGISNQQVVHLGDQLIAQGESLTGSVVPYLESLFSVILETFVVSVLSIYLVLDGEKIAAWVKGNTPDSLKSRFFFLLKTTDVVMSGYIRGQMTLAAIIGILISFGMLLLHVPYAVLLGVLAFFLAFIPTFGTIRGSTNVAVTNRRWTT